MSLIELESLRNTISGQIESFMSQNSYNQVIGVLTVGIILTLYGIVLLFGNIIYKKLNGSRNANTDKNYTGLFTQKESPSVIDGANVFCRNCGSKVDYNDKFCFSCGAKV